MVADNYALNRIFDLKNQLFDLLTQNLYSQLDDIMYLELKSIFMSTINLFLPSYEPLRIDTENSNWSH